METLEIMRGVTSLVPGEATPEQFGEAASKVQALKDAVAEISDLLNTTMVEHIQATGNPIPAGPDMEWRLSRTKRVKCRNPAQAVTTLLEITGGDLDAVGECLAANPLKHGAVRSRMEQAEVLKKYDEMFEESWSEKAELKQINKRFIK